MKSLLLIFSTLIVLTSAFASEVRNGSFDGTATNRVDGGEAVIPPEWNPVNFDAGRKDRINVQTSDRPGAGQCVLIDTKSHDSGIYQSIQGLEDGRCYLLTAWIKRLSGRIGINVYSYNWGPNIAGYVDDKSTGWQQISLPITPLDGGMHLYLGAAGQAEYLVDDVVLQSKPWRLEKPVISGADISTHQWHGYVTVSCDADATPEPVMMSLTGTDAEHTPVTKPLMVNIKPGETAKLPFTLPFTKQMQTLNAMLKSQDDNAIVAGSPLTFLGGTPWVLRFPYKDSLFSSMKYRDEIQVRLSKLNPEQLASIRAVATISNDMYDIRSFTGRLKENTLTCRISARDLPAGTYRLRLTLTDSSDQVILREEHPLYILPPANNEVVCAPDDMTRINGERFFPIGLYWVFANPSDWLPGPQRPDALWREIRDAGFNTLHTYAFEHNDASDTDENALAYLDTAQKFGFKVMMGFRREWVVDNNIEAITQRIARLKDHPALLCWTIWDEPNLQVDIPWWLNRCTEIYKLVDALDPYHPAMEVFGTVSNLHYFTECTDVNLWDYYPGRGNQGVLPPLLASAREQLPAMPLWYAAQAYNNPTEQDMRDAVRYALDADATAIFWYSFGGGGFGWDSCRQTPELWEALKRVTQDLNHTTRSE